MDKENYRPLQIQVSRKGVSSLASKDEPILFAQIDKWLFHIW